MKRLKRWVVAFLIGEFFTLLKKDKQFKKWVIEKEGVEKVTHIFQWLFTFNKQLVEDARDQFDAHAFQENLHQGVDRVQKEYAALRDEFAALKATGFPSEAVREALQKRFDAFSETALLIKEHISSFDAKSVLEEFKKVFESLAKQSKNQ